MLALLHSDSTPEPPGPVPRTQPIRRLRQQRARARRIRPHRSTRAVIAGVWQVRTVHESGGHDFDDVDFDDDGDDDHDDDDDADRNGREDEAEAAVALVDWAWEVLASETGFLAAELGKPSHVSKAKAYIVA